MELFNDSSNTGCSIKVHIGSIVSENVKKSFSIRSYTHIAKRSPSSLMSSTKLQQQYLHGAGIIVSTCMHYLQWELPMTSETFALFHSSQQQLNIMSRLLYVMTWRHAIYRGRPNVYTLSHTCYCMAKVMTKNCMFPHTIWDYRILSKISDSKTFVNC